MRRLLLIALLARPSFGQAPCVVIAEPQAVRPGESVLLRWECKVPGKVRLDPGGLILPSPSQVIVKPAYTTTYSLSEAKAGGAPLGSAVVKVEPGLPLGEPARVCSFDASAKAVLPGEPVVLKWECAGSAKVRLEPGGLELDGKSEVTVTPLENTRYTLTATNAAGGASRSLEVAVVTRVEQLPPAMVCAFTADRRVVKAGEQVELRWVCQGDAKVRLEPGGLELDGHSSIVVVPESTTVYTLSVSNLMGGASRSLEIQVEKPRQTLSEADLAPAEAPLDEPAERLKSLREADLPGAIRLGQGWRSRQAGSAWTLRLVVSGSAPGLKSLGKIAGAEGARMAVLPYIRKDGFRWWQACWGAFPNPAEARRAWSGLPEALRRSFPQPLALRLQRLPGDPPPPPEG
jgi:hypothetical protein